jgi:hypothetical protein
MERPTDVDVRSVDGPVLMRCQRLLETAALLLPEVFRSVLSGITIVAPSAFSRTS